MARKPRMEFPHAFYHVIARGNQKKDVFWDEEDYKDYLSRLKRCRDKYNFIIYAYCLMPNHVHLLIESGDVPLSKAMHCLQFSYTQSFNRRHKKVGHLFQGRYKSIVCDKDAYLLELVRYIHLNPVRGRLVNNPEEYYWSSHCEYIKGPGLIDSGAIHLFGRNKSTAVGAYKRFIWDGMKAGHREEYYQLKDQRVLGDDGFAEDLIKRTSGWQGGYWNIEMGDLIKMTCEEFGANVLLLRSIRRCRREALARGVIMFLAKKLCGMTLSQVGALFGRNEQAMSYLLHKIETLMVDGEAFAKKLASLEKRLIFDKRPLLVRETRKKQYFNTIA